MYVGHVSTAAHDAGIAVLCIIIIVLVVVVAVMLFRRFARRRRRLQHFLSSMKGAGLSHAGSSSAVNFVTMIDEPDVPEFQPHDRQLQIINSPPHASA